MSSLEFASGSDDLAKPEQEKLATLAKALVDRPALQLSITGLSDPSSDRAGLLQAALDDALVARRRSLVAPGKQPPPDEQPLTDTERTTALRALFLEKVVTPREQQAAALKAAGKPVPAGLVPRRDLPLQDAEPLVLATMTVSPDDFTDLARSRAESVQEAFRRSKAWTRLASSSARQSRTRRANAKLSSNWSKGLPRGEGAPRA